ncbi:hypothetical protein SSX86_016667 [Deinandra increscens subsp. villosa]|uniref:Ribosomal protein S18 n=1 Tax=Deinandra increscens subsp. villosa TaxID=3103831 RepID=A0AAP0CYL6_9ASTR
MLTTQRRGRASDYVEGKITERFEVIKNITIQILKSRSQFLQYPSNRRMKGKMTKERKEARKEHDQQIQMIVAPGAMVKNTSAAKVTVKTQICRAGELSNVGIDNLMTVVANPRQFKIPYWFLNRKKDYKDAKYSQVTSNALDMKLRDDLERLKKIRNHRGLRHYWGKTVGLSKKR